MSNQNKNYQEIRCVMCEKDFKPTNPKHIRCGSTEEKTGCSYEHRKILSKGETIKKDCESCKKEFDARLNFYKFRKPIQRYCSKSCRNRGDEEVGFRKGHTTNVGKIRSIFSRIKQGNSIQGKNHWNWKGGITPENDMIRQSSEYKLWRKLVFKRDGWTCMLCGYKRRNIIAHHIKLFSKFPDLRFVISNGRTLCEVCHYKNHTQIAGVIGKKENSTISLYEIEILLDTLKKSLSFVSWGGYEKKVRIEVLESLVEKFKEFNFDISKEEEVEVPKDLPF